MKSRPSWIKFKALGLRYPTLYHQLLPTHPISPLPVLYLHQTHQTPEFSQGDNTLLLSNTLFNPLGKSFKVYVHWFVFFPLFLFLCVFLFSHTHTHTHTNHLYRIGCVLCPLTQILNLHTYKRVGDRHGGLACYMIHGVAKSWTRLSDFTFTFHFHALEKEMATHSRILAWRVPGTGEPDGLPSMGSHRVRHD